MSPNTEPIPFARPSIGSEEEAAALRVLRSGWLTTGGEAAAFEGEFAEYVGARHAVAVSSATAGLHLALEAVGVGPGDRVIVSPYTFTASVEVIRYLGAEPLFCDIEEATCNIDPAEIERVAEAGEGREGGPVRAILPVHVGGMPCEMATIKEIAARHSLGVVEDAAHSLPGKTDAGFMGTLGDAGVFSFYATKSITTAEGGMLVTNNDDVARRAGIMRLHGIDRDVWNRYRTVGAPWEYDVVEAGFKYNMPDLLAAVGRVQLGRAAEFHERRRTIAKRYLSAFGSREWLRLPPDTAGHAWHLFAVGLELDRLSINRNEFASRLNEQGIGTSVHYKPLHLMSYYRERYALKPADFPVSLQRYHATLSLPIYPALADEAVERVISAVLEVGDSHHRGRTT